MKKTTALSALALICLVIAFSSGLKAQAISTIAGTGGGGFSGDGGPGTAATLTRPYDVVVDRSGNIFISDDNQYIRKLAPSGIITSIAGVGISGYSGDGGPATDAEINYSGGMAVDNSGNLYFTDYLNSRVRIITPAGIINTIAGTGTPGFSGDGGPATAAMLNGPESIAIDLADNIYIAEAGNSIVRKISPSGIISTYAGTGTSVGSTGDGGPATAALLAGPSGIAVDDTGNVYIADLGNSKVRKISVSGTITTIGGTGGHGFGGDGGPATSAIFSNPYDVAVDYLGNVYIADAGNSRVRMINPTGIISTVAGSTSSGYSGDGGAATAAELFSDKGVSIDRCGNLYISDQENNCIRMVSAMFTIPPFHGITGNAPTMCLGATMLLSDSTIGGVWTSTNIAVATVSDSGIVAAFLRGMDTIRYSICFDTSSVMIATGAIAGVSITSHSDSLCTGHSMVVSDSVHGGTWLISDTSFARIDTTGVISGIFPGHDTIVYTISNSCGTDTAYLPITIVSDSICTLNATSIVSPATGISVYPNPAIGGRFWVLLNNAAAAKVTITNLLGQRCGEFTISGGSETELQTNLGAGVYLLTAVCNNETFIARIVVTK